MIAQYIKNLQSTENGRARILLDLPYRNPVTCCCHMLPPHAAAAYCCHMLLSHASAVTCCCCHMLLSKPRRDKDSNGDTSRIMQKCCQ